MKSKLVVIMLVLMFMFSLMPNALVSYASSSVNVGVKNNGQIPAENSFSLVFSEKMNAITSDKITFPNNQVTGVTTTDNTEFKISLSGALVLSTEYVITLSGDITSQSGNTINVSTITIKTAKSSGNYSIVDDNSGFTKIFEKSSGVTIGSYPSWFSDAKVFNPGFDENPSYVKYKVDGDLTGFSFNAYMHGARVSGSEFVISVSADNVNYTTLPNKIDTGITPLQSWIASTRRYATATDIPTGMKYLKIGFPLVKSNQTPAQATNAVSVGDITINYKVPQPSASIKSSGTTVSGLNLKHYVDILFSVPIDEYTVSNQMFKINDQNITIKNCSLNSDCTICTLELAGIINSNTEYQVQILNGIKSVNGLDLSNPGSFKFESGAKINRAEVESSSLTSGGVPISSLVTGDIVYKANIMSKYANGESSQSVTLVLVLYQNDKIIGISFDSNVLDVGNSADFQTSVKVADTSNCKLVAFIWDDMYKITPLCDKILLN